VIADIHPETGDEAARIIRSKGLNAKSMSVDVTRRDSVENLVSQTIREFGQIDILVNCAGIILRNPLKK